MPIIKNKKAKPKTSIIVKLDKKLLEEIKSYCHWAGIYDLGYFIEQITKFILVKDKEWKQFLKDKK